jgi:hypothetical protein
MTTVEQERLKTVQQAMEQAMSQLKEAMGEGPGEGTMELIMGSMLAAIDATFAIRDGQPWRGISDPQEIARKLLQDAQLGE